MNRSLKRSLQILRRVRRRLPKRTTTVLAGEVQQLTRERDVLAEELVVAQAKVSELAETRLQLIYHRDTLRRTRARLEGPSFHRELQSLKNFGIAMAQADPGATHPMRQLSHKLRVYDFAASHGVPIPKVFATWQSLSDIDLGILPEAFVLKSDGGAASHGVLPLRRVTAETYMAVDGARTFTSAEVVERFAQAAMAKKTWGAYFAEELLEQPDGGPIPDDVKVYVAYGRVLQILLRRVTEHGAESAVTYKYVTAAGEDLGAVTNTRALDATIPVPDTLPDMVHAAKHLSMAIGLPFCRVDLYNTTRGVVLGEVTRTPGGPQTYVLAHDRWMGEQWLLARADLELDIQRGRSCGMLYGRGAEPPSLAVDLVSISDRLGGRSTDCAWCDMSAQTDPGLGAVANERN